MNRTTPLIVGLVLALLLGVAGADRTLGAALAVPEQYPTIGDALTAASRGDIVLIGCGTYRERNLQLKSGVSLWSATLQPECVVIDAEGRGRVLIIDRCDSTTTIAGLTLRGGRADEDGGAIVCRDSSPRIRRCNLEGSVARAGGGLACQGFFGPVLEDCLVTGNHAEERGGGILWTVTGPGRLTRVTVSDNDAIDGGGLAIIDAGGLDLVGCNVIDNTAGTLGGGMLIDAGLVQVRHSLLARNVGGLGGSALASSRSRPRLVACTVVDNLSDEGGQAIALDGGALLAERVLLAFNRPAALGGSAMGELAGCNIFGHPAGDWQGMIASLVDQRGNFSADPRFCDREGGHYELRADSPCLPGIRDGGNRALVGARGQGCP